MLSRYKLPQPKGGGGGGGGGGCVFEASITGSSFETTFTLYILINLS